MLIRYCRLKLDYLFINLSSPEHDVVVVLLGEGAVQIVHAALQAPADLLPLEHGAEGEQVTELGQLHPELARIRYRLPHPF